MTLVDVQSVSRRYGARPVLSEVSLTLNLGDRVGLVGANGSGKSTLARIVAGEEEADSGQVVSRRGARIRLLPQEPRFEGDPTALEAALGGLTVWNAARARHAEASEALGRGQDVDRWMQVQADAATLIEREGGWDIEHRARAMLTRVGVVRADQPVSTMSGGERRRVDLARLLVVRPDLGILDEPTNHLDLDTIEWLEEHLAKDQPGAFFIITHDRYFLDRVVTRTAELERGKLHLYAGGYEAYLEAKADREAFESRAEQNRQNLLRRELAWLRRSAPARTTKQKARIQRAKAVIDQDGPKAQRGVALHVEAVRGGRTVLDLEDLVVEVAGRTLIDKLTLSLVPGERLGIVGPNGSGKTSLLRTLTGELSPASGTINLGASTRITYFGQAREGLEESMTVFDNVAGGRSRVTIGERTMDTRAYLERFLFDSDQIVQPVSALSGGEKARALLAKLLLIPTNLLILDEPTNDLDTTTLSALEEMLIELSGTALVVTHDRWFLDRVATGILAFEGEGKVVRYAGGYTDYKASKTARASDIPRAAAASSGAGSSSFGSSSSGSFSSGSFSSGSFSSGSFSSGSSSTGPSRGKAEKKPKKKALTLGESLELEGLMDKIGDAEAEVATLEGALAAPDLYADGGERAATLVGDHERAKSALATLIARWEELEEKKAEGEGG